MKYKQQGYYVFAVAIIIALFFNFSQARAQVASSSENIVSTSSLDSDGDGYPDATEIKNNYSPYNPAKVKINQSDMDKDGLTDDMEIKFGTNPLNPDTDGDGYKDGAEVDFAYNPLSSSTKKLSQKIEVDLKTQKMTYYVGGQIWKQFTVSSGKASMPTPKGKFKIINKSPKAWSNEFKLWMPYWLGLDKGEFGIHELPVWPSGYREGANHLGIPVSHGCVRLGIGPAKYLYDRLAVGTEVDIK